LDLAFDSQLIRALMAACKSGGNVGKSAESCLSCSSSELGGVVASVVVSIQVLSLGHCAGEAAERRDSIHSVAHGRFFDDVDDIALLRYDLLLHRERTVGNLTEQRNPAFELRKTSGLHKTAPAEEGLLA
jgi:hypothetical protein